MYIEIKNLEELTSLEEYKENNIIYGTFNKDIVLYRNVSHYITDFIVKNGIIYGAFDFMYKNKLSKILEINIQEIGVDYFYMKVIWSNKIPYINIYKK